ncbi:diacylglycerol/lipid kinase family protein [Mangrovibacterium diazotrophicum]|uniref:YegS/Rv2252/BmrU family lipid kinase n=1 Tax=Mangrovibacterium diazotrophicum TaxID=1261403 RepID=A0A419VWG4_9BACT|nr:diacylglycerol kinase family protein [Mangrovibacterium diazotrophicum]RKD86342.1 YegS/Rv2252/BmrU family lipid kinase [Mangrovibacterium diazotrophicum]
MPNDTNKLQPHILFVINPISGDVQKDDLELKIRRLSMELQFVPDYYFTTGDNDEHKLTAVIEATSPDRVVAVGGDGTCNMVGKVLLYEDIPLGIVPLGSANGMARELGIPTDTEEAISIAVSGRVDLIDTLQVNQSHMSLHLSDIGINAAVIERFEKENIRGLWGYARQYAKALFEARPIRFTMDIDGQRIRKRAYMAVFANASMYGTGAVVNPKGKLNDGKFEVVLFRPYRFAHLLGMLVSFFTGNIHEQEYVDVYSCRKAEIRNSRKHVVQVDGEVIGQFEEVSVEILPRSLTVVLPK